MPPELRPLFVKGTVNGADLYETLKQMRIELRTKRSARAWTQTQLLLDASVDRALSGGTGLGGLVDQARKALLQAATNELKAQATIIAYQALDEHLSKLLGTSLSAAMASETVTLPDGRELNAAQAKRAVTMGTMVIAARLTGRLLDEAEKDFKNLEVDYKALLEQREKAAELLFLTIDKRRAAIKTSNAADRSATEADLSRTLSQADLEFIDRQLNTMNLTEFQQDMAAQNLALRYLRTQDPKLLQDYSVRKDKVVTRTDAYLKSLAGVAAFASLSANMVQNLFEILQERDYKAGFDSLPMLWEFAQSARPFVVKTISMATQGAAFPEFLQRRNLFTVTVDGTPKEVRNTKAVFDAIQANGTRDVFAGILFRDDALGWLNGVRRCDIAEAGRMIDAAVPARERADFADKYLGAEGKGAAGEVSLTDIFTTPNLGGKAGRLPDDLLGFDHRVRFRGVGGEHLAKLQSRVGERFGTWSDQQMLRLIFANREGAAAHATMDLGRLTVRPAPSPQAVYVYEAYVNTCIGRPNTRQATPPAPPAPPVVTPPPPAAQKPSALPAPPPKKTTPRAPAAAASTAAPPKAPGRTTGK